MSLLLFSRSCFLPITSLPSSRSPSSLNRIQIPNKNSNPNPIFVLSSLRPALAAWQPPKYVYPDPDPVFAVAETDKFKDELKKNLLRSKESFGDDMDDVVMVCAEIFNEFLHKEYGGPGTLMVEPFTDMLLALKEKKLRGATVAARTALLWAQNYVDKDWEIWNSQPSQVNTSAD
ncbi:protein PLASTID REDOX INSENSITIVE 2-like isoform X2 [Asparagus officinalis]|uniref:protein PLASTID REDOX INSENSITIVE 2-like isoform X2 n=1 Tax=Asparagus officinalis TaxID=4686 RepID=UPI00098E11B5|nr:protein PLASTID REDOX INSENSITIVE 2-like isoform X2 [Asparagus officinalis]